MKSPIAAAVIVLALALAGPASADSSHFSGYEFFPGVSLGNLTFGASFFGWTDNGSTTSHGDWLPYSDRTGGFVTGSIDYTGKPGYGHTVTIVGGTWSWREADGTTLRGRVLDGTVEWPSGTTSSVGGCPDGVATFTADVALGFRRSSAGRFTGCLDDQLSFPPKIWGVVEINN